MQPAMPVGSTPGTLSAPRTHWISRGPVNVAHLNQFIQSLDLHDKFINLPRSHSYDDGSTTEAAKPSPLCLDQGIYSGCAPQFVCLQNSTVDSISATFT